MKIQTLFQGLKMKNLKHNMLNAVIRAVSLCCALKSVDIYAQSSPPQILVESKQLIVLMTPDWNAVNGTLRRYQRESVTDAWRPISGSVPVVIG